MLLLDRGFLDGETLWTLKHDLNIDWVIPARADMDVTADARQLARQPVDQVYITAAERPATGLKGRGQVTVRGVFDLSTFSTYGDAAHQKTLNRHDFASHPVNAVVVTRWRDKPYSLSDQPVFLTSLDVCQPLRILDAYDLRSLIENTAFRELKQGWCLLAFPKRTRDAARAHIYLTLLCFTLVNAFHSHQGQSLSHHGIRHFRSHHLQALQIVIFDDDACSFASFALEEFLTLLGHPPLLRFSLSPPDPLYSFILS